MKLGFIGTGNMAGAIMGGIIRNGVLKPEEIIGSDILEAGREKVHSLYGICVTDDNREAAKAEIVVLSVKPQYYEQTIAQIRDEITDEQVIVTLAPGKTLEWLQGQFGKDVKIVRTMPNTPAMVGAGMTAACANALVTKEELEKVLTILRSFGEVEVVSEHLIDAVVSASGSSPAYVFMMIEAMADAAVADGMPRPQAYKFAAQAVMGSAKMGPGRPGKNIRVNSKHGMFSCGNNDRSSAGTGRARFSKCYYRGNACVCGKIQKYVE